MGALFEPIDCVRLGGTFVWRTSTWTKIEPRSRLWAHTHQELKLLVLVGT